MVRLNYQKIQILIFASIFLILFLPFAAQSQQIRMGPPIIEFLTTPGSEKSFYINILNQSDTEFQCSMLIKSMALTDQGLPVPVDSAARSAASWLKIQGDKDFILRAKENKQVRCTFQAPFRAESGGYYGTILCKTANPQNVIGNTRNLRTSIHLRYQFASIVMAIVKGSNVQAKIDPQAPTIFGGNRAGDKDRDWYVEVPVRNDGNIHVVLAGEVRLLSEAGQQIERLNLIAGRGYLLPGQIRSFKAAGKGPLPDGVYVAVVSVGQSEIKKFATERIPFYVLDGQVCPGSPNKSASSLLDVTSQGFMIDKPHQIVEAMAGGRQFKAIQITNITNQSISLTSKIIGWNHDINGNIIFSETSNQSRRLSDNIVLLPDNFEIKSNQRISVKINISLPKNASGEFYDALVFNRVGVPQPKAADLLLTQSVLLTTKAKTTEQISSEIVDFSIKQVKEKGFLFVIVLKNTGNTSIYPDGRISIFDAYNIRVDDQIAFGENIFVLPQNERKIEIEFNRILAKGNYRAELTCTYSQNVKEIQKLLSFTAN